eukprot:6189633-Pleurochrysis_carterae.AAC.1
MAGVLIDARCVHNRPVDAAGSRTSESSWCEPHVLLFGRAQQGPQLPARKRQDQSKRRYICARQLRRPH